MTEMSALHAIRTAGAVRTFSGTPVSNETVYAVLDCARFAPSGGNQQPWRVMVIADRGLRKAIRDFSQSTWNEYVAQAAAGVRPFAPGVDGRWPGPPIDLAVARDTHAQSDFLDGLVDVPVMLVVLVKLTSLAMMDIELDRHGFVGGGSIYPFCHNILLSARAVGLGGTMTTFLTRHEPAVRELLDIPQEYAVASMITLGYPVKQLTRLTRRAVSEFATVDRFDGPVFGAVSGADV